MTEGTTMSVKTRASLQSHGGVKEKTKASEENGRYTAEGEGTRCRSRIRPARSRTRDDRREMQARAFEDSTAKISGGGFSTDITNRSGVKRVTLTRADQASQSPRSTNFPSERKDGASPSPGLRRAQGQSRKAPVVDTCVALPEPCTNCNLAVVHERLVV